MRGGGAGAPKSGTEGPESRAWCGECPCFLPDLPFHNHGSSKRRISVLRSGSFPGLQSLVRATQLAFFTLGMLRWSGLAHPFSLLWSDPAAWRGLTEVQGCCPGVTLHPSSGFCISPLPGRGRAQVGIPCLPFFCHSGVFTR